jgi:signal transduction histidine kinase
MPRGIPKSEEGCFTAATGFYFDMGTRPEDITDITIRSKLSIYFGVWARGSMLAVLALLGFFWLSTPMLSAGQVTNSIEIRAITANGRSVPWRVGKKLNLSSTPKSLTFNFGPAHEDTHPSLRYRCQLEGYENTWHQGDGFMFLAVRFFNAAGDQIDQKNFQVTGESAGWDGKLKTAVLTHRRETLVVPTNAARASVVISSAGPPASVGIYVVANLVMSESSKNSSSILLQSPFDQLPKSNMPVNDAQVGWIRDGTHLSMAKIVQIGRDLPVKAFAIEDNDTFAHAEWRLLGQSAPSVAPGDRLVVEWNEMFSIGVGDLRSFSYPELSPGNYRFHVIGVDMLGNPDGEEAAVDLFVPRPFWQRPWFWSTMLVLFTAAIVGGGRYVVWRRMKLEMVRLKSQQALEGERLRIAHDIHDDLGARVTQITMVSAMSLHDPTLSEKTREDLNQIKRMSRDLVTALYETVWAVNPEYDNLDALGSYLCQMVNQQCDGTQVHCRLHVSELPHEFQVSSQTRHNITMVVKEAINNVIKHAMVSEVVMNVTWQGNVLDITIADTGCGFDAGIRQNGHYGLTNMKQRMQKLGGNCSIESKPGAGTVVHLQMTIKPSPA